MKIMWKQLYAAVRIESVLFLRDFFGFFFTFLFPGMMLLLYGSIYGNEPTPYFNGMGSIDVLVPALSVMIIGVTGLMAFPLMLTEYKDKKIYKRFDATPAGKGVIIGAQSLVSLIMTLAGFALLLLIGKSVYRIQVEGNFILIFPALLLAILSLFALGFFITAAAPTAKISNVACYVSYFVMIFLSGATMPKEMFPEAMLDFSVFLPMTHAVNVLQGTFRNAPFPEYRDSVFLLLAVFLVCTGAGALLYRRKSWN